MAERVEIEILATDKTSGVLTNIGRQFSSMGRQLTTFVTLPFLASGVAALKAAADYEQTEIAFSTMLGDAGLAKDLLQDLAKFASTTPFQLPDVEAGAKQLLAMGAGLDDVLPELRMLGDVSAGLNVPMSRLILNFGQVRVQGKLTGRELRDFAIAGVPLVDELARSLGVAKEEIAGMVERGEISFDMVQQAFQNMTSEGGRFNNLMQAQSQTTAGQFSNLMDQLTLLGREIGAQLLPVAMDVLEWVKGLVGWFAQLDPGTRNLILIVGGLAAALGPLLLILGAIFNAAAALTPVFAAIGAFLSGPLLIPVLAIVAVLGLLYAAWTQNWGGIRDLLIGIWNDHIKPALTDLWNWLSKVVPQALQTLANFWNTVLLPAITAVWNFISAHVLPLLGSLANLVGAVLGLAIRILAGLWQNVLWPAIQRVWDIIANKLWPIVKSVADFFSRTFGPAIRAIGSAFDFIKGIIDSVASAINSIHLPDWLTPGSPTPLELGLKGIGNELTKLARTGLPQLSLGFSNLPEPAFASAGGTLQGGGVAGATPIILQFSYAPVVSFADANEVRTKLLPMLERGIKQIVEQTRL